MNLKIDEEEAKIIIAALSADILVSDLSDASSKLKNKVEKQMIEQRVEKNDQM
jgi:hypothetical protein